MNEPVQRAYESLLDTVFPRWKAGRQWCVKVGQRARDADCIGSCDLERKVIWVSKEVAKDDRQLRLILVHEIVHAIVGPAHNKRFWQRLYDAAQVAKKTGQHQLASDLQDEWEQRDAAQDLQKAYVYGRMRDLALEAPSFEAAVSSIVRQLGHTLSAEELCQKYPKLRAEWDNTRKRLGLDS